MSASNGSVNYYNITASRVVVICGDMMTDSDDYDDHFDSILIADVNTKIMQTTLITFHQTTWEEGMAWW